MGRTNAEQTDMRELKTTSVTDPALNAAVSTAILDQYSGVIITTTAAANAQTLQSPTDTTKNRRFTVVNDDDSTDPITVNGTALAAGNSRYFIWDGDAWAEDAGGAGTNDKVSVDSAATAGYLGATAAAGALRVDDSTIGKTDGGDFITLGVKANGINDTHIDWGTGANQVSAADVPNAASDGANTDITSLQNAALATGRDADNKLDWSTDDQLDIVIGGVTTSVASVSTGAGDNDKLVTQGYVDDNAGGGFSWGATATDTSGTGLTLTLGANTAGATIGQKIVADNTQSNVGYTLLALDCGTSSIASIALDIKGLDSGGASVNNGLVKINEYGSNTQATGDIASISIGSAFNTSSTFAHTAIRIFNRDNASSGKNTGVAVQNIYTTANIGGALETGAGVSIYQTGVDGTAITAYGGNNTNCSTNGLVNFTLSDTQSGASIVQKIDTGASAQAQVGLLVNAFNASTSARGVKIDGSTTGTGLAIECTGFAKVSTNFTPYIKLGPLTIWISDGTAAEGNLTGVEGDICLNGGTGAGQMAYCDSAGTNWTDM